MLNLTLKFRVESNAPDIFGSYESVFLVRETVSFPLYLSVTPEIPTVSLGVRLTYDKPQIF